MTTLNSSAKPPAPAAPADDLSAERKRPLRILYAEDVPELREVVRMSFARDGHDIECCADGALALDRIVADRDFDLIITDHHMPNMNGLEFVAGLRELDFPGKVMVFSSGLSEDVAREYRELNVDRILHKPALPSALRQNLRDLFPVPALVAA